MQEVTALAVHPHEDVVASGQAGKEGIVCLFDASRKIETGQHDSHPDSVVEAHAEAAVGLPPVFLRELSLGKKEKRGVRCCVFTPINMAHIEWTQLCYLKIFLLESRLLSKAYIEVDIRGWPQLVFIIPPGPSKHFHDLTRTN